MTEEWRAAFGTDGRYEVSNQGHVRRASDGLPLAQSKPSKGREYPAVMLRLAGKRKRATVHSLVALTFLGNGYFHGLEVCHINGDPTDPRLCNLRWGTRKDNSADRERHGRTPRGPRPNRVGKATGSENGNYSVTPEMKERACSLVDAGQSQRTVADALGISQKSVWRALQERAASLRARIGDGGVG